MIAGFLHRVGQHAVRNFPVKGYDGLSPGQIHLRPDAVDPVQNHGHGKNTVVAVHAGNLQGLFSDHRTVQLFNGKPAGGRAVSSGGTADTSHARFFALIR